MFDFSNQDVCLIFMLKEIYLIEYGVNSPIGSFKTSFGSSELISIKIFKNQSVTNKIIAYLLDTKTLNVVSLISGEVILTYTHTEDIKYLELNYYGNKLLFKDGNSSLFLISIHPKSQ